MYLKPYLQRADLVIGNLEVTLAGPPYKGYPQFSSPDELADALKDAGFHILVNANNHALDRNREGLVRTIGELVRRGILHTGTFTDARERMLHYPLIVEKSGIRIALLNYTYGTNGLRVKPPSIVNRIDTVQIQMDLLKARSAEPDFTIVSMHWGSEYQLVQNKDQEELAEFLFRHGTDVILGSHPHVVQPVGGSSKGDLVVYSVGNFISNRRNRYRNGGILLELELVKDPKGTGIGRHAFLPVWVYKPSNKKGTLFTLVPAALDSVAIPAAQMSAEDYNTMRQFLKDTRTQLDGIPEIAPDWLE
jgi:poly-gamma-glutamate synthesis protein (capsule biosynthesis protein)